MESEQHSSDPSNWSGGGGEIDIEAYLINKALLEHAVTKLLEFGREQEDSNEDDVAVEDC